MRDIFSAIVLCSLLLFAVNPMHFWMPNNVHMGVLGALITAFGVVAAFVAREWVGDERELSHRALAGRTAFLTGASVLIIGIVAQGMNGPVDPWLATALGGMVLAKVIVRAYADGHF